MIPSLSYSFNPGSFYRSSSTRNAFASLIFGGFDASRYIPNQVKFGMNPDAGRELTVGLRTITKSDTAVDGSTVNSSLLTSGILARLDSSQPYIWLPIAACKLFEQAFGLSWDNATGMYLVNETLHHKLLSENATVVFGLTDGLQGTVSADITLPYGALDLQALPPLVNNAARYFPLKRTANESQVSLIGITSRRYNITDARSSMCWVGHSYRRLTSPLIMREIASMCHRCSGTILRYQIFERSPRSQP